MVGVACYTIRKQEKKLTYYINTYRRGLAVIARPLLLFGCVLCGVAVVMAQKKTDSQSSG